MAKITEEYFIEKVGSAYFFERNISLHDDLERCNCELAGEVGHYSCGWCSECDLPRFMCGHLIINKKTEDRQLHYDICIQLNKIADLGIEVSRKVLEGEHEACTNN